jgi:hypothetical protein
LRTENFFVVFIFVPTCLFPPVCHGRRRMHR